MGEAMTGPGDRVRSTAARITSTTALSRPARRPPDGMIRPGDLDPQVSMAAWWCGWGTVALPESPPWQSPAAEVVERQLSAARMAVSTWVAVLAWPAALGCMTVARVSLVHSRVSGPSSSSVGQ